MNHPGRENVTNCQSKEKIKAGGITEWERHFGIFLDMYSTTPMKLKYKVESCIARSYQFSY
jgi:hypothetical protein